MIEFLKMGGYAWFVWPSYAITAAVLWLNWYLPRQEIKRQLSFIRQRKDRASQ